MPLLSRVGLCLVGLALLVSAGCRKARAPEPTPVSSSSGNTAILAPQPSHPVTPFTLQVESASLKVAAGASTRVKVTAARTGYLGLIMVELRNLPARVTAPRTALAAGEASVEIEVTAAADAATGSKTDVQAVGMAAAPSPTEVASSPFTLDVTSPAPAPFSLKTQQAAVKLAQGARVKIKITTVRNSYQGPVTVELRNLPSGVEAPKGLIQADKNEVELELTATSSATLGIRKDLAVLGTTTAPASPQVVSPSFSLEVVKADAQDFALHVEPARVVVKAGGRAKVTVVADRTKGYKGPITVDLQALPGHVTAAQNVIPEGKDRVSLELYADPQAVTVDKLDVSARGQLSAGDNHSISSPTFIVSVLAVGHPAAGAHVNAPRPGHPASAPKAQMPAPAAAPRPPSRPPVKQRIP
jgi:hypothetical protein